MAFPSYTYTFTNGSTADATQVNQNFTDILNGISDTTKDISVNAVTAAGAATLNGAVTLGNSSAKLITITGSIAASILLSANTSWNIGAATAGLAGVYIGGTSTFTTRITSAATSSWTLNLPTGVPASTSLLQCDTSGNLTHFLKKVPTVQSFLSGSGTYTTPAGVAYIRVTMVGGGGGGDGSGTTRGTAPGAGGNTTFGTTLLVANGGGASVNQASSGGSGGSASLGSGPVGLAVSGGSGGPSINAVSSIGGFGGNSILGGGGGGGQSSSAAFNGATNTGGGGGGGGSSSTGGAAPGSAGGAGGGVIAIITSPLSTYAYAVGAAGTAGAAGGGAGSAAGGAGGSGCIIVEEFYI